MKKNIRIILPSFLLLIFTMGLTLVYASFNASMTIDGIAAVEKIDYAIISNAYKSSTGTADYSTPTHTNDTATFPVELANGSSITFELKIFNNTKDTFELINIEQSETPLKIEYSTGCFLADELSGKATNTCDVTITNNTGSNYTGAVTSTFTFEPYIDQTLNHKVEVLTAGIDNGVVSFLADDRESTNHQITYIGTDPNNYVMLNGHLFRMIGLDTQVDDGTGNIEERIKIISESDLPDKYAYSKSDSNKNYGAGVADFAESELRIMLNTGYYNSTSSTCYTESGGTQTCSFENEGLGGTSLIGNTLWHYGAHNDSGGTPTAMYSSLYGTTSYTNGGCGIWLSSRYCSYKGTEGTTYTSKIGLMSPSDFGFSTSGNSSTSRSTCLSTSLTNGKWTSGDCINNSWLKDTIVAHWVIQPAIKTYSYSRMFIIMEGLDKTDAANYYSVKPTAYLNSNVVVYSGNGTRSNPYIIDLHGQQGVYQLTFDANGGTGVMTSEIFASGKQKKINTNTFTYEGHTFMGWSKNSSATIPEYNDGDLISITEDTALYAVWKEDIMLYDKIEEESLGVSTWNYKYLTTNNGVYLYNGSNSDGGNKNIYYYSGPVENNNILFADLCWKIMRTTSTGGIKLLYNGTYNASTGCSGNNNGIKNTYYNNFTTLDSGGYMYESGKLHGYSTDSTIKSLVQSFYVQHLAGYTSYLEDANFCNNRTFSGTNDDSDISEVNTTTSIDTTTNLRSPTLSCSSNNDIFNVGSQTSSSSIGNKALTLPIGLPTADEMILAGTNNDKKDSSSNEITHNNTYIYNGTAFWTMTPRGYDIDKSSTMIWRVDNTGRIGGIESNKTSPYYRPVVSLNADTVYLSGSGSEMDPIIIQEPKVVKYGLTYYANGGTGEMQYRFVSKGEEIKLSPCTFTRSGYHFLGWATTSNNEVVYEDGQIVTLSKDTMLYAVWERDSVSYDYTGTIQSYTVPKTGLYRLETWGAQGGNIDSTYQGGYGAYATGFVNLTEGETLYIVVGGQGQLGTRTAGQYTAGGYNGGGFGYNRWSGIYVTSGGGATHIAKASAMVYEMGSHLDDLLMISGGGAGAYGYDSNFWSGNSAGGIRGGYSNASTKSNAGYINATYTETDEEGVETEYTAGFDYGYGGLKDDTGHDREDNQSGGGAGWRGGLSDYGERGAGGGSSFYTSSLLSNGDINPHFAVLANTTYSVADNIVGQGTNYQMDTTIYENARTFTADGVSEAPLTDYAKKGDGYAKITYYGS